MYNFITVTSPDILSLNKGTRIYLALLSVTKTKYVKVVFCPEMGSSPIGASASVVDGKILLLQGNSNAECRLPT